MTGRLLIHTISKAMYGNHILEELIFLEDTNMCISHSGTQFLKGQISAKILLKTDESPIRLRPNSHHCGSTQYVTQNWYITAEKSSLSALGKSIDFHYLPTSTIEVPYDILPQLFLLVAKHWGGLEFILHAAWMVGIEGWNLLSK